MEKILLIVLTILCTIVVARFILKKYNPVFIFFASGIVILALASVLTNTSVLGKGTTGNMFIDIFAYMTKSFQTNSSGIGSIIMAVTGYSVYMSHIKASNKLAVLATKPLAKIKMPYLVLSGMFLISIALKLVITSQAGLSLLLITTTFPVLLAIGVNRLTAASVLCLVCLDWGPNDGSTIFAAEVAKMPVVELFINYQLWVCLSIIAVLAVLIPFYYKYVDRKEIEREAGLSGIDKLEDPDCPDFYVILPTIPLLIVLGCSLIPAVKMDVVTATFIGFVITFTIEFIVRSDRKEIANDMKVVLRGMADIWVNVVSIIIAASVFAKGIEMLGGISIIADTFASLKQAPVITTVLMTLITTGAATLMGSGAASLFAFGPLVPGIAVKLGIPAVTMIIPMELGASIGRSMSPVAGAIIAVSGYAGVDTMKMIKRTSPLLIIALIINSIASYVFGMLL
jgi:DcuC family C4-dicarboxylate transporter